MTMERMKRRYVRHTELPEIKISKPIKRSRCAFCGRLLDYDDWHWFWDEYGQRVKKCNNELECSKSRRPIADESFRRAIRRGK
jgi:hypothetical protein